MRTLTLSVMNVSTWFSQRPVEAFYFWRRVAAARKFTYLNDLRYGTPQLKPALARPNHDSPDIVMETAGRTVLVESKATLGGEADIKGTIDDEIPGMARLVISALMLDYRPVMGLLVGTLIRSETDYFVCISEVANAD